MSNQDAGKSQRAKVLIVDDEPDFVESVEWQLTKRGYRIFTALSGKDAIDLLRRERIDVLLADIRMPEMDGIELIRQAAGIDSDLQSIVLTGHGGIDTAVEAMRLGAINYLRKPVGVDELDVAIQKGIERRVLIRTIQEKQDHLEKANQELSELRKKLEKALEREIEERKHAQGELQRIRVRESLVETMNFALRCWKQATRKSKIDLAEESRIWTASVDTDGTYRTRTMDRYLKVGSLPSNPRTEDVLDTGYFVLPFCSDHPEMKKELEDKIHTLENLIQNPLV
jgi:YesN/AraC family two-component response regulator